MNNNEVGCTNRGGEGKIICRREKTRWMMLFYDTLIYAVCWLAIIAIRSNIIDLITLPMLCIYIGVGYLFFLIARFALQCYKCIYRYGQIYPFSREFLAGIVGSILLIIFDVILTRVAGVSKMPFVIILLFTMAYVIVSLFLRFAYCYLYRFAKRDGKISRILSKALTALTFVNFNSNEPGAVVHPSIEFSKKETLPINELQSIIEHFAICGEVTSITQINKGYINRTYKITTLSNAGHVHKYILQRINTNVFPDVDALMENFELTTHHLHEKLTLPGKHYRGTVQTLRPLKDGSLYLRDDAGCFRMLTYFDHVCSMDIPDRPETFYYAGVAFGSFIKEMADIDATRVKEVIPNFHNTVSRYRDLEDAIARDPKGRVKSVESEIAFIRERADGFGIITDALSSGKIPTRICHNDCNLNNILFDIDTHLPVAIIDLDTVMPSSPLYDFGDSMRIGTNTAKDDEKDLSKVSCDLNLYEHYARGYLEACGDVLTEEELLLLPYASLIITAEDGIRFLMDHINGDTYYHIYYPGQNLDRSRTQLKLLSDMEKKLPEIKKILNKIYKEQGLLATIEI